MTLSWCRYVIAPVLRRARVARNEVCAASGRVVRGAGRHTSLRAVGVALVAGFGVTFLWFAATSRLTDLAVYRMGGAALLRGDALYAQVEPDSGLPFTYTPFAAAVFTPFALLARGPAQVVWTIGLLAALFLFCARSVDAVRGDARPRPETHGSAVHGSAGHGSGAPGETPPGPGNRRRAGPDRRWYLAVLGFALVLEPVRSNLALGQINIVLGLLILLDLNDRRRPAAVPGGVLIGIAAGIKLTPLVFVPYLLFTGRVRAAVTAGVTFCGTAAFGALVSYQSSRTYWTELFLDADHIGGIPYVGNQSTLGVLSRLMSGAAAARPVSSVMVVGIFVAGLVAAVLAARGGERVVGDLTCAVTGLLVSPISWSHHWVWCVPILLWLAAGPGRPRWGRWLACSGYALLVAAPIWWVPRTKDAEFGHHGWQLLAANSYYLVGATLLTALVIRSTSLAAQAARAGRAVRLTVQSG